MAAGASPSRLDTILLVLGRPSPQRVGAVLWRYKHLPLSSAHAGFYVQRPEVAPSRSSVLVPIQLIHTSLERDWGKKANHPSIILIHRLLLFHLIPPVLLVLRSANRLVPRYSSSHCGLSKVHVSDFHLNRAAVLFPSFSILTPSNWLGSSFLSTGFHIFISPDSVRSVGPSPFTPLPRRPGSLHCQGTLT